MSDRKFVLRRQKKSGGTGLPGKPRTPSLTTVVSKDLHNDSFSANSMGEPRTTSHMCEEDRLELKVGKVRFFWANQTLLIPNVFRLTSLIDGNNTALLEHQDLSRKEVLAQNGGVKGRADPVEREAVPRRDRKPASKKKTGPK